MKSKLIISLTVLSLLHFACGQDKASIQDKSSDKMNIISQLEVDEVLEKWLKLWATYDISLLPEIFYQSEDLTYFSSEKEGLIQGYSQMLPHHQGFGFVEGGKDPPVELWLVDIETRINGETALVAATWYNGDRTAPPDSVQHGPVTFVLLRDDGGAVKISHAHFANN